MTKSLLIISRQAPWAGPSAREALDIVLAGGVGCKYGAIGLQPGRVILSLLNGEVRHGLRKGRRPVAQIIGGLEQADLVAARQQPRCAQAGDSAADHGNPALAHRATRCARRVSISGIGLRSHTRPTQDIALRPYQVTSYSHQRMPCRAEPGKK